jgi:formate hydrogenlyase subunit 3/multisubunit Na+/H+ antiporter MnhD subunit
MNWSHVHLMLNHIPVLGVLFGLLLLFAAKLKKSAELEQASLAVFVLMGAASGVVYYTGEQAEIGVTQFPEISKTLVLQHDDAAFYAVTSACILGGIALIGLLVFRGSRPAPRWFGVVVLLLALITSGLVVRTANLGGYIRHPEIRSGAGGVAP